MFVGWGGVYPGREVQALKGYQEWITILDELKEQGEIDDFVTLLLSPTGGDLNGFTLVFADEAKLMQLTVREDIHRLQLLAEREFAKFMLVPAVAGARVTQEFKLLEEEILPALEPAHA